jgi:hypothetical protein
MPWVEREKVLRYKTRCRYMARAERMFDEAYLKFFTKRILNKKNSQYSCADE